MLRKAFTLGIAALAIALLLAACAGGGAATTAAPATAVPTEAGVQVPTSFGQDCAASGSKVKEIKAVDSMTVEFDLCSPDPAFLEKVAFSSFAIQPSEWLVQTGGTGDLLEHPVGTGPYMLDNWARGDSVTFKRFDGFWGTKALTETLIFRWNSEAAARLNELRAGTVDGIDNPNPEDYDSIKADASLQLLPRDALTTFYIGMTNTFKPFDDVRVRQAIAMGIDRQRIVDNFYPPGSTVADYFTPCAITNACVGDPWYSFDPTAAKALLADAGFPDGFSTTLYYRDVVRSYLPHVGDVAVEIQSQLKDNLNIDATINVMESGTFIQEASAGNLDGLYLLGWGADYPHVTNFLDYHFGKGNPQFGTPYEDIYTLLEQGAAIADPAQAEPIYAQANDAIKADVPMVPVAHGASAVAYRADVTGAQASPLGNEYFAVMQPGDRTQFVWMQNAEPISLFCADESDGESLRACEQVTESLYAYEVGGTKPIPALATSCDPNADLTVWTCHLRSGVKFQDGSDFDATDVIASWWTGLDFSSPLHVGNSGAFDYWDNLWGGLNKPAE